MKKYINPTCIFVGAVFCVIGYQIARFKYGEQKLALKNEIATLKQDRDRARSERDKVREARDAARLRRDELRQELVEAVMRISREDFVADTRIFDNRIVAKVTSMGKIPDPKTAPYKECLAMVEVECLEIFAGKDVFNVPLPQKFRMSAVAFADREPGRIYSVSEGDMISFSAIPEDIIPEEVQTFQTIDATEDFLLPLYYGMRVRPVESISEAKSEDIHRKLQDRGNPVLQIANRSKRAIEKSRGVELSIAALKSWKSQLNEKGIEFVVASVPTKKLVKTKIEDPIRNYFFDLAEQEGINCLDILPSLLEAREKFENIFYEGSDEHPADGAIQTLADEISKALPSDLPYSPTNTVGLRVRYSIPKHLEHWPAELHAFHSLSAERVFSAESGEPISSTSVVRESPILLIGDSFIGVPRDYEVKSANLIAHLFKNTGILPAVVQRGGGAAQMMKTVAGIDGALENRKVVVFAFSEGYFYRERDWVITPIFR